MTPEKLRNFKPSHYQQAILDFALKGRGHGVVNATAGSGKSTTLEWIMHYLKGKVVYLAFNKSIVNEFKEKNIPRNVSVMTLHSLGWAAVRYFYGKGVKIEPGKYLFLAREMVDTYCSGLLSLDGCKISSSLFDEVDAAGELRQLAHFARVTLTDANDREALEEMVYHYDIDLEYNLLDFYYAALPVLLSRGRSMSHEKVDFDDQIWLPATDPRIRPLRFNFVLCDECQDLSAAQAELAMRALSPGGRLIAVGDPNQCQPGDTEVMICRNGERVPSSTKIEDLSIGDPVVTYDRSGATFIKEGRVTDIHNREYQGMMYVVRAGKRQTRCTPNHKWLVRWSNADYEKYCTYLMKKGNAYRVGQCRLFLNTENRDQNFDFGLASRCRQERADAAWILKVHGDRHESVHYENIVAAKYSLPQMCFNSPNGVFEDLYPQEVNVERCLEDHGRLMKYPFYSKKDRKRQGRSTLFEIQSCNLIPGHMAIPVPPEVIHHGSRFPIWETIQVEVEEFEGLVYSMNVEKYHKYVADGMVTCNSVYGFSGADTNSFNNLQERLDAKVLPLSICYRCDKEIVRLAQEIVPEIEYRPNAEEGQIRRINRDQMEQELQEGDLVLCRTNAPLIELCFSLISEGISAQIKGRDIGTMLVSVAKKISKMRGFKWSKFVEFSNKWGDREIKKILKSNGDDPEDGRIQAINDKVQCLSILYSGSEIRSLKDLSLIVEDLFSDERPSVWLSSVHRAKGLENERVYNIRPELLPGPWAESGTWQYAQEMCLKFVMITRAKHELVFVSK